MADKATSVLAKLKNESKKQGIQLQQLLNLFCQEEFIRRLSQSRYRDNLILKGGFLLYSMSNFTARPTVDADYLLKNYANNKDAIESLVREVISLPSVNDYIKFEIRGLEVISEIKEYHGIRVNLTGFIRNTKTPLSIDFGVGDIIVPSPVERTLPAMLPEFEQPKVLTYSLESTVAEKLDAIIALMEATGRMKDFYDIYYIAITFNFEGRKLQEAIYETLSNRGRPYEKDSVAIIARLAKDVDIQKRWNNFCKKVLKYDLSFDEVVKVIIDFTLHPYTSIIQENDFFKTWNYKDRKYV
ncbi:nucleotidyl transferase AbiEii/AbiGii toxin family protein [Metallumcola ferriviriculae]|uniref:Nucleotidyl transferase AbiEii/AbiGii toxin family protein n=1 Tax=Metallumcola ferriviriculae TaxID=3039180 RepID=A0AAU0UIC9_9FIRM|nr:nucleotidyl transferase AbiEii/AbiGii toxin family protein [Desulfitibacteraceae bacterium MK1]